MEVIPAVDIRAGRSVRLYKGDFGQETVYGQDPAAMAARWEKEGARVIHVVDLDGAREGRPVNVEAIEALAKTLSVPFQIGGGIRTLQAAQAYLDLGAARVILGTAAVRDPDFFLEACGRFPGRIVLGLDAREGKVALSGWLEESAHSARDLAQRLSQAGPAALIYTDIGRDGTHQGVNVEATAEICRAAAVPVIAAGGISTLEHVLRLKPLTALGLYGVITGRAIYDGTLDLKAALAAARAE